MPAPGFLSQLTAGSPAQMIDEMSRLFLLSRALHSVAELQIADHLDDEPLSVAELAARSDTHPPSLGQLLRFLTAYGVFEQVSGGRYVHSPLSQTLRRDHSESQQAGLRRFLPYWWRAVGEMAHTVRTGESAFNKTHGTSLFEYLRHEPEAQARFDEGMARTSDRDDKAVAAAYDFSKFRRIMDVGGGRGGLLAQILLAAPKAEGILFDQPQVVERATRLSDAGVSARATVAGGNFFDSIPDGPDCAIIKGVLHDFDDEQCVTILANMRRAISGAGHVIIANQDIPTPLDGPHPNLTMDIQMMTVLNGRERNWDDWLELLSRAGLRPLKSYPSDSLFTLIDSVPA